MTLYPGAEYVLANHISYSWLRRGRAHTPDECRRLALQTIGRVLWWLDPPTAPRAPRAPHAALQILHRRRMTDQPPDDDRRRGQATLESLCMDRDTELLTQWLITQPNLMATIADGE